jgi:3-deoxy-D-arabino-heptulosonate 7-phosphate (DAHP) synthase
MMADARVTGYKTVRRQVVRVETVDVPESVELTLSPEEAQFISDLLSRVGGDKVRSRRQHAEAISRSLDSAGFKYNRNATDVSGDFWCADANDDEV